MLRPLLLRTAAPAGGIKGAAVIGYSPALRRGSCWYCGASHTATGFLVRRSACRPDR